MQHDSWLTFGLAKGVTGATCSAVLERFGSIDLAIRASSRELLAAGLSPDTVECLQQPDTEQLRRCADWLERDHCHLLTWTDPAYPLLLREISSAPPLLFVRGHPDVLQLPQLAIVGSRSATPAGIRHGEPVCGDISRRRAFA